VWGRAGSAVVGRDAVSDLVSRRPSPFTRLARTHAAMAAGDAIVAVALAGSVFFDTDPRAARWRVALFLALTMAPFTVLGPLVAPAIDRMPGGRRLTIALIAAARALVSLAMVAHIDSLALFPEALVSLVLSKAYVVSKSAVVPTVVTRRDELVEANAKLGLTSGVVGFVAAVPAALLQFVGSWATVALSVVVFMGASVLALALPRDVVAGSPAAAEERAELKSGSVVVAASAMALLRAMVGFLTFHIAFWLRSANAAPAWFGLMLIASAMGTMAGNGLGPRLRRRFHEERMIAGSLTVAAGAATLGVVFGTRIAAAVLAAALGLAASLGRASFDSIVQRDAPEANRGRAFAQFETRFQMAWVVAAFVPVTVAVPHRVGFVLIAIAAGVGLASFVGGMAHVHQRGQLPPPLLARVRREVARRRVARSRR
jgi:Transmembrane secretion effector